MSKYYLVFRYQTKFPINEAGEHIICGIPRVLFFWRAWFGSLWIASLESITGFGYSKLITVVDDRMKRAAAAAGSSAAGSSYGSSEGLLCPGVRVVPTRKLTKDQLSGKDDETAGNGFGSNVQTLEKDILHLQEIFPGKLAFATGTCWIACSAGPTNFVFS
jgi:hypothetical protein